MLSHFFTLLSVALGHRAQLSSAPTAKEWEGLFAMARQQALLGVLYPAIERLPEEQHPPRPIVLQWYMLVEKIKQMSLRVARRAEETCRYFEEQGFDAVVMKGAAVSAYYPQPELRMPGDIDIWVAPKDWCHRQEHWMRASRRAVARFAQQTQALEGLSTHHIHFDLFNDVEVEVHFKPSYLYEPLAYYHLDRYFEQQASRQFHHRIDIAEGRHTINALTVDFDRYYILLHIFRHYFGEGIGLRQLMDYYYVLLQDATPESKAATVKMFRRTGMYRFACATMWLMQRVFSLPDDRLLCPPDAKAGQQLLDEVMRGGNFGQYDDRLRADKRGSTLYRVWYSFFQRNLRYLCAYPRHVIWDIPFRAYQVVWRNIFPQTL